MRILVVLMFAQQMQAAPPPKKPVAVAAFDMDSDDGPFAIGDLFVTGDATDDCNTQRDTWKNGKCHCAVQIQNKCAGTPQFSKAVARCMRENSGARRWRNVGEDCRKAAANEVRCGAQCVAWSGATYFSKARANAAGPWGHFVVVDANGNVVCGPTGLANRGDGRVPEGQTPEAARIDQAFGSCVFAPDWTLADFKKAMTVVRVAHGSYGPGGQRTGVWVEVRLQGDRRLVIDERLLEKGTKLAPTIVAATTWGSVEGAAAPMEVGRYRAWSVPPSWLTGGGLALPTLSTMLARAGEQHAWLFEGRMTRFWDNGTRSFEQNREIVRNSDGSFSSLAVGSASGWADDGTLLASIDLARAGTTVTGLRRIDNGDGTVTIEQLRSLRCSECRALATTTTSGLYESAAGETRAHGDSITVDALGHVRRARRFVYGFPFGNDVQWSADGRVERYTVWSVAFGASAGTDEQWPGAYEAFAVPHPAINRSTAMDDDTLATLLVEGDDSDAFRQASEALLGDGSYTSSESSCGPTDDYVCGASPMLPITSSTYCRTDSDCANEAPVADHTIRCVANACATIRHDGSRADARTPLCEDGVRFVGAEGPANRRTEIHGGRGERGVPSMFAKTVTLTDTGEVASVACTFGTLAEDEQRPKGSSPATARAWLATRFRNLTNVAQEEIWWTTDRGKGWTSGCAAIELPSLSEINGTKPPEPPPPPPPRATTTDAAAPSSPWSFTPVISAPVDECKAELDANDSVGFCAISILDPRTNEDPKAAGTIAYRVSGAWVFFIDGSPVVFPDATMTSSSKSVRSAMGTNLDTKTTWTLGRYRIAAHIVTSGPAYADGEFELFVDGVARQKVATTMYVP